MHNIFFKKNRKGQKWLTSETIIFFFGAILLIATIAFFFRLQSAVFAEGDDGSIANLKGLNEEIKELLGTSENKDYELMNYFIGEGKMLLGFNKNANGDYTIIAHITDRDTDPYNDRPPYGPPLTRGPIYKPFDCGNSACLCLYNDEPSHETDKRGKGVLRCEREGTGKSIFFLGQNIFVDKDPYHRTKYIYIEKTFDRSTDTYEIYISRIDTSDPNDESNKRKIGIDASR